MNRPYYDCPIKAAFMARYQGIRFDNPGLNSLAERNLWPEFIRDFNNTHPASITEASLPLLEPSEKIDFGGNGKISGTVYSVGKRIIRIDCMNCLFRINRADFIIERRNGKAFIAPEKGEV